MENASYILASDSVIWEKIGKQIVIADLTTGKYCCIENDSGAVIWECLTAGQTQAELIQTLSQIFNNFDESCHEHVSVFIKKLTDIQILVLNADSAATEHTPYVNNEIAENAIFKEPRLLIYSDLDTLLMIDPIDDDLELEGKTEDAAV